ncbi:glycoside hydrolase family 97 catalytic domain-containing protein [Dactylosporangium sp. CS-033363]|uniref:glycoside hydrolase family 97 catalytic domain-containing protein n=1 Tax=Dactylosporangium sp. CS-033363 TaxID=3239935 RepID=UPI003D9194F7
MRIPTLAAALLLLPATAVFAFAGTAAAATTWTVTGPSAGTTAAQISLDNGTLTFAISNGGQTVLSPSPIGIATTAADLTRNLTFTARTDRTVTEAYTMATGKQRARSTTYNESTLSFTGTGGARLDVVVRASNTGAAYRYVLPGSGAVTISREASSWTVPSTSNAWLAPPQAEDQGRWIQTTAGGAPTGNNYRIPALFEAGGRFALVAETDLDGRYAASYLTHAAGSGTYNLALAGGISGTLPLSTPWRTAAVGDLATVTTSTIVDDLAAPSKVADTSWVKPGTVAWSWLTEHASPSDEGRQRQYVDFAARNGWSSVLIDEGWSSSWVPSVVTYAKSKGVGVILWFNSADLKTSAQRENWLPLIKGWGVAGVKVDFIYEDTQPTLQWYDAILARTAQLQLMVNFHGAATPRGLQRTWPHVMTAEAVFGAEQYLRADFNTILPFTRNAIASMDFTPVVFSLANRDTTDGHELGTSIVFESGWQHLADNPQSYDAHPEALRILDQLPTAWDETRLLGGRPGQEAYLARRSGTRWFIGGISALNAKTFTTPLSFLGGGQYLAETVRDGTSGLVRETRVVTNADTLSVAEATRGGFATVVCPYSAGMSTCGTRPVSFSLRGTQSGRCADVPGAVQTSGTQLALWDCNGGANQAFTLSASKQLQLYGGTKCLDVAGAGAQSGAAVQIWDCNGQTNQQWNVNADGTVVGVGSGKCLDATANGTANGTLLEIWSCNGGSNQRWNHA